MTFNKFKVPHIQNLTFLRKKSKFSIKIDIERFKIFELLFLQLNILIGWLCYVTNEVLCNVF